MATTQAPLHKRAWDYNFISSLSNTTTGAAIQFALTDGKFASGIIQRTESKDGELIYVSGTFSAPEPGRFFFQKQTMPGKQGDFAGVVEFPGSKTAWRIEPTGPGGKSELIARRLDEVICYSMPPVDTALLDTNSPEEMPPLRPDQVPDYVPLYNDGIISLQSLPGAVGVLYIDFRGGYTPTWGGITYAKPNVSNAQIKDVWKRVAEDYMPFTINVTTDIKVYQAAPENSRQRCICTPTTDAAPGAGGVSYVGSWNSTGDTPNWSFYSSGKAAAEVIAHECGHALGLLHDGQDIISGGTTNHVEYYGGQGSGYTDWAPIMGVGYGPPVVQWSKGEYQWANNHEDDLNKITSNNNNVDYRADDTGATLATARYLEIYSNNTAFAEGVIETTGDTDAFRFTTAGGTVSLTAYPVETNNWANLAIMARLADATDTIIASNNPQTVLTASITTNLPAGTYTFRVTGAGRNDPFTNGFSNYDSLGYYSITGTVANATQPTRFVIGENSTNGFLVGTVTATNLGVDALNYFIVSGNTSNTFALDDNGLLSVTNAATLNYETLALKFQSTVQFEMFVNITNTVNPLLTELNRRVVVQVTNVNEAPLISGFTNSLIAHTQPGTVAGTVQTSDPDFYSVLTLAIVSGNSNAMFSVDSASGNVTVNGDLDPAVQSTYNLGIKVTDNGAPALSATNFVQINVISNASPFSPGSISYAIYDAIGSGTLVVNLTTNSRFPADPTSERQIDSAEGDSNRADSYGSVLRGYLIPPVSGNYNFYIASDDKSELWMSTTTNPASMTLIASVTNATASEQWNKYAIQKSAARALTAGQGYYMEARHKEGTGNDYLAVGWSGSATSNQTNVIPGTYLAPYFVNYLPHMVGFTNTVRRDTLAGGKIGQMTVTDVNSNDLHSFTILTGNSAGIFGVDSNGWVYVANDATLAASVTTNFTLSIRTTDNGTPALSATNPAKITIISPTVLSSSKIQWELFYNIGNGTDVPSLTSNAKYPGQPDDLVALTNFASEVNIGDSYGSRIRALLTPSVTGDYRFFIASDDNSQLKFSRDTNAANATVIASVSPWVNQNVWNQYASQMSIVITNLIAGQSYYIEALHKEGGGGDHVEVGWLVPGSGVTNLIPGANLLPVDINYAPTFNAQSFTMLQSFANGTAVGTLTASDSPLDTLTFKIVGGNTNTTFALDAGSGLLSVANNTLIASGALNSFTLNVAVQDSGYGSLYPLHAATNNIFVTVLATNGLTWDAGGGAGAQDGNGNWAATPKNWWNGDTNCIWTNGLVALFGAGTTTNCTVTITNDVTAAEVVFNANKGGAYTIAGTSGALNISGATVFAANDSATISAAVKGVGASLIKGGVGTLTLSGTNTFTGGMTINAGMISLASSNALGNLAANTLVANGAELLINGNLSASGAFDISGAGIATGRGALHLGGSANVTFSGAINLSDDAAIKGDGSTVPAITGPVTLNNNTLTIQQDGSNTHTVSGSISGAGGLVKSGAGTLTLSGANSYAGGTTHSGGIINANSATALGSGPVVFNGGIRLLLANGVTITNPITIGTNAGAVGNNLIQVASGSTATLTGPITINNVATAGGHLGSTAIGGVLNVRGPITVNNGLTLVQRAGTVVYSGGGNYTNMQVNIDKVVVGTNNGLATAVNFVSFAASGATTLDLNGFNQTIAGITNSGTTAIITNGSTLSDSTLTVNGTAVFGGTIASAVSGTKVNLAVSGGVFTLTANNTYRGTTAISGGTLALTGVGSIANSPNISVGSGGTFDVSGLTTAFTLGASQTLSNNAAATGNLVGPINTGSGKISVSFSNGTPALNIAGSNLNLSATTAVAINNIGAALTPGTYLIVSKSGSGAVAGTVPSSVTVTGGRPSAGTPSLAIVGGQLYLTVGGTSSISYANVGPFTYNGAGQGPTANFTGSTNSRTSQYVGVTFTYGPSANVPTNVGTYYLTNTVAVDVNYFGTANSRTFTINPASLLVRANDTSRNFGAANPTFTASYSGFVFGQTLGTSDVGGAPLLTTTADANSAAGNYPIIAGLGSLTSTNYSFVFSNGLLTVIANVPLTITNSAVITDGGTFTLSGVGNAGQDYVLLTATNLAAPIWLPIATNTADTNGVFQFADPQMTNFMQRYYRVQGN